MNTRQEEYEAGKSGIIRQMKESERDPIYAHFPQALFFHTGNGHVYLADQGGFIPTEEEFRDLVTALSDFYDACPADIIESRNRQLWRESPGWHDHHVDTTTKAHKEKKPRRAVKPGHLYAIRSKHRRGPTKLGYTQNLDQRLLQLDRGFGTLEVLWTCHFDDVLEMESALHEMFSHCRLSKKGELFDLTEEEITWLESHLTERLTSIEKERRATNER